MADDDDDDDEEWHFEATSSLSVRAHRSNVSLASPRGGPSPQKRWSAQGQIPPGPARRNVVATVDLRLNVHQDSANPTRPMAKIQAHSQATDRSVPKWIKSGNKGSGHSGNP
ncbi:MAG: hypothetical protein M1826_002826 [Phylliscum demangeonii]|nr:MAG: hypothetical protein M1826_002826 [Phylliscum demangeonii]